MIKCCYGCKPPKRYPGCGSHCPEYIAEKAQLKADQEKEREEKRSRPVLTNRDFTNVT